MNLEESQHLKISKRKKTYPISVKLLEYLKKYDRFFNSPITYEDLLRYEDFYPILDKKGNDTLWIGAVYNQFEMQEIHENLKKMYQWLKSDGNIEATSHLIVDNIDYCTFGNSHPFRIKIRNQHNDNHDYFYVKIADASRVYGLELEQILSPNHINFMVFKNTLVEEHISGIPGDIFIEKHLDEPQNKIRIAKEFVKFNERCIMRLLGDQRSYNFVVVLTPDFDQMQYRIRSIDFDQQSYEGDIKLYKPQYFKENYQYVRFVKENLKESSIKQYQDEERSLLAKRMLSGKGRLNRLLEAMKEDEIAPKSKVDQLKMEVYDYLKDNKLKKCESMGEVIEVMLDYILRYYQRMKNNK